MRSPIFSRLFSSTGSIFPRHFAATLLGVLAGRFGITSIFIVSVIVLSRADSHTAHPELDGRTAPGIIERAEVLTVWLPQALLDLSQSLADPKVVQTPENLRTCLQQHGLGQSWYALTYRGYQTQGGFEDITLVRRPCESPEHLRQFQDVIALVAERPPQGPPLDFANATIGIIPDRLLAVEPRQAVAELIGLTPASAERLVRPTTSSHRSTNHPTGAESEVHRSGP